MHIVHTCLRYPPATGGAETYVHEIVERTRHIPERDTRVLTSQMRTHGPISALDPELLLDDPMYVQRLHYAATPLVSYPRLQALKYYIGHHQPDILHSYSFWYQPADVTARYAKRHNIPFIFTPFYYPRKKLSWQIYKHSIGQNTFAAADAIIIISPFEKKLIEDAGFSVKRFELIPPGVDTTRFERPRLNPFLKKGLAGKVLLAVSRLAPGKGLEDIITAFPNIAKVAPDTHLVIIGEDFGILKDLQTRASPNIHFWGKADEETLIAAYQSADIFVHPSHYEAFGIVVAEALAAGTPVVARNANAIPFVAPHERTGLLFKTPEELTQHIITLLQNDSLRGKYGQAGTRHVRESFNWGKSIAKILRLYDELRK